MKLNAKCIAEKAQKQRRQRQSGVAVAVAASAARQRQKETHEFLPGPDSNNNCSSSRSRSTMNALGHWPVPARSQCRSDAMQSKLEELQLEEVLNLFESCNSCCQRRGRGRVRGGQRGSAGARTFDICKFISAAKLENYD